MNRFLRSLMVLAVVALPVAVPRPARADKPEPPPRPKVGAVPPAVPQAAAKTGMAGDTILPEVNFASTPLEDALDYFAAVAPGFSYSVVRDEGIPKEYPKLHLKLKQVSLSQVLELIHVAYPTIEVVEIGGYGEPIVCVKVHAPPTLEPASEIEPTEPTVRIHRLSAIVESLAIGKNDPATRKDAMNRALSLIKIALEQVGGEPPVLRVHEETQTLIFKGNPAQEAALKSVMDALQPTEQPLAEQKRIAEQENLRVAYDTRWGMEREKFDVRSQEMAEKVGRLQKMLDQRDKELLDHAGESERLKVRLEEATRQIEAEKHSGNTAPKP